MHRLLSMKRLSLLFLATFAVLVGGVFVYQALVVAPEERCERRGGWWDGESVCAHPISIAEITQRPVGQSRAEASDAKNRELLEIEDRLAAAKAARDAEVARQREALLGH